MLKFQSNKTERLDKFLATKTTNVSRGKIQRAIKDGLVSVNGKKVLEPDFQLTENDQVELPEFKEEKLEATNYKLNVIFENDDLAVIDKPAGLMVHPAAGRSDNTLAHALLSRFPGIEKVGDPHRPGIVHRLDEDTSGLLLVAKTADAYEFLKNIFLERKIEKEYLTLVHGVPEKLHGVIDVPVGKTGTHQKMSVFAKSYDGSAGASRVGGKVGIGKPAVTEYSVLANDESLQYSLLKVKLHTGRTHQIRVHLASIGHPVVGDQLYGGKFKNNDLQLLDRQFLHAHRLKLRLQDGTWLELVSELPDDLQSVLKNLRIPSQT